MRVVAIALLRQVDFQAKLIRCATHQIVNSGNRGAIKLSRSSCSLTQNPFLRDHHTNRTCALTPVSLDLDCKLDGIFTSETKYTRAEGCETHNIASVWEEELERPEDKSSADSDCRRSPSLMHMIRRGIQRQALAVSWPTGE